MLESAATPKFEVCMSAYKLKLGIVIGNKVIDVRQKRESTVHFMTERVNENKKETNLSSSSSHCRTRSTRELHAVRQLSTDQSISKELIVDD